MRLQRRLDEAERGGGGRHRVGGHEDGGHPQGLGHGGLVGGGLAVGRGVGEDEGGEDGGADEDAWKIVIMYVHFKLLWYVMSMFLQ